MPVKRVKIKKCTNLSPTIFCSFSFLLFKSLNSNLWIREE
jgi:hypothetical protein